MVDLIKGGLSGLVLKLSDVNLNFLKNVFPIYFTYMSDLSMQLVSIQD